MSIENFIRLCFYEKLGEGLDTAPNFIEIKAHPKAAVPG